MTSIRDVAKKANVATCTVSRVLNGSSYVAPETKAKIEKAMKELNYIPNELARSMFRQKAGIIAMIVPDILHPFFSTLAKHIEEELYKRGFKMMLCSTSNNSNREKDYINILMTNMVDGVIVGVNSLDSKEYKKFNKPIIMLDRIIDDKTMVVVSDHEKGGKLAANKLIESGCKNIIHISGVPNHNILSYKSHISFEATLKDNGVNVNNIEINWSNFEFEVYYEWANKILDEYKNIDGVFAADMVAAAFLKSAVSRGKRIPQDFKIVAYDGTYTTNSNILSITTVVQQVDKIAEGTVELIINAIEGKTSKEYKKVIDVFLREGQTSY
jgi:LacI family sucrose operon transcriptional repressor